MDGECDQPFFPLPPKEVPRLDSMKPLEKHYSVVLPTVSHSGFLYKTASAGKPLQDRRAREGGCQARPCPGHGILAWRQGQRSQSWPGWGTHEGARCPVAESPCWASWLWSRVHSRCLISGLIGAGVGHGTGEQVTGRVSFRPRKASASTCQLWALCWACSPGRLWMPRKLED